MNNENGKYITKKEISQLTGMEQSMVNRTMYPMKSVYRNVNTHYFDREAALKLILKEAQLHRDNFLRRAAKYDRMIETIKQMMGKQEE